MRIQVEERGDNQSKCLDLCKQSSGPPVWHWPSISSSYKEVPQPGSCKLKSFEAGHVGVPAVSQLRHGGNDAPALLTSLTPVLPTVLHSRRRSEASEAAASSGSRWEGGPGWDLGAAAGRVLMGAGRFHFGKSVTLSHLEPCHDEVGHPEEEEGGGWAVQRHPWQAVCYPQWAVFNPWWALPAVWNSWWAMRAVWNSHLPSTTSLVSCGAASWPRTFASLWGGVEVRFRFLLCLFYDSWFKIILDKCDWVSWDWEECAIKGWTQIVWICNGVKGFLSRDSPPFIESAALCTKLHNPRSTLSF